MQTAERGHNVQQPCQGWVPHHLCDTLSRNAPTVPPTKLQKPPRIAGRTAFPRQNHLPPKAGTSSCALANAKCLNMSTASSPQASGFENHHHQPALVGRNQLRIHCLLVHASLGQGRAVHVWVFLRHPNALGGVTSTASCDPPNMACSGPTLRCVDPKKQQNTQTPKHTNWYGTPLFGRVSFTLEHVLRQSRSAFSWRLVQRIVLVRRLKIKKSHMVEIKCQDRIKKELSICHFFTMSGPGYTRLLQI